MMRLSASRSVERYPRPRSTVTSSARCEPALRVARCSEGLRISTSELVGMSPALRVIGPLTSMRITTGSSFCDITTTSFKFMMNSVMSSVIPLIVVNSCSTPSNLTVVIAAPGIDDNNVRRSELPIVWPKPGSSGPTAKR